MIYYNNASYLELVGNHMAKTVTSFIDSINLSPGSLSDLQESFLNLGNILFHGVAATSYAIGGIGALGGSVAKKGRFEILKYGQAIHGEIRIITDNLLAC